MSTFDLAAIFLVFVGIAGWINARFFRFPTATAMVLAGLLASGMMWATKEFAPDHSAVMLTAIQGLDFPQTVLGYMLGFLLFAGASHVQLSELRQRVFAILGLATLGVAASTVIVGLGLWFAAKALGLDLDLAWAMVFGALISPTDPIAVLAAVKQGSLSKNLEAILQGEALFNDGVGIVVFFALLALASSGADLNVGEALLRVGIEAIGGALLGGVAAWLVIWAMRAIDDYPVEVGLSIALATGAYSLAHAVHVSGPIAVVVAGLMVGNRGQRPTMSANTEKYLRAFWTMVDEILNALLFLLLGLQVLVVPFDLRFSGLMLGAVMLVTASRFLVVLPTGAFLGLRRNERGSTMLLAWGGLHGALSLAMALSIPAGPQRELILSATFAVVIFSIVVQGLTFAPLAKRFAAGAPNP